MSFINKEENMGISFDCPIRDGIKPTDHILFSYTYPFNLNDIEYSINEVEEKCKVNQDIQFERKLLTQSLEGRKVELITLTSKEAFN